MRLLEKKDLTYEEALTVTTTMELSEKSSVSIQGAAGEPPAEIDYLQAGKKPMRKTTADKGDEKEEEYRKEPSSAANTKANSVAVCTENSRLNYNNNTIKYYSCGKGHLSDTMYSESRDTVLWLWREGASKESVL